MKIVALTGSIGMGKSTTVAMFKDLGVPVWDADAAVHRIYARGGSAVEPVRASFPTAITNDKAVDRDALSKLVLGQPDQLKLLEGIVHPLVGQDRAAFLSNARKEGAKLVILDIPLLFETGGQEYVDGVIVVSCNAALQRQRVLARPGMTEAKFEAILTRQTPDAQKRARADFIITTDHGLDDAREQAARIYQTLMATLDAEKEEN